MSIFTKIIDEVKEATPAIVDLKNTFDPPSNASRQTRMETDERTVQAGIPKIVTISVIGALGVAGLVALRKKGRG